jgi:nitrogen fixation/metabolism regulation signal transduction histidine kinase
MALDFKDYLELIGALVVSIGGASVVVVGLSKWFGDFMSKRLLDSYNNQHKTDLEGIKSKYQQELASTKTDLDKAKSLYMRYTEKQFDLYNDLWRVLLYTKRQADSLWKSADAEKIPSFIEQVELTKNAVDDNMLLIEEEHFNKLDSLIRQFEQFRIGKERLIDLRKDIRPHVPTQMQATATLEANREWKEKYDDLILEIGKSFRTQIKG